MESLFPIGNDYTDVFDPTTTFKVSRHDSNIKRQEFIRIRKREEEKDNKDKIMIYINTKEYLRINVEECNIILNTNVKK